MIAGSDGALLAALIAEAGQGPSGARDLSNYTGQIVAWDEISGTNVVAVNGGTIPNMRVIASGIGLAYQVGDVVNITARGTQWFINGKVGAPGAGAGNQIASDDVNALESTSSTSYTNLATFGPQVTVNVGSSRRVLIYTSATIQAQGTITSGVAFGGAMTCQVSGASTINELATAYASHAVNGASYTFQATYTRQRLVTAADGLNSGPNTFTAKYLSNRSDISVGFDFRTITVIPF